MQGAADVRQRCCYPDSGDGFGCVLIPGQDPQVHPTQSQGFVDKKAPGNRSARERYIAAMIWRMDQLVESIEKGQDRS